MSSDHFGEMFPAVCAGFGLFLAGAANLALLRRGLAVRAAATLLAAAATVGAAWAIDVPGAAPTAAAYFAAGMLPCLILASRRLVTGAAAAVSATQRPAVRFGLLTAAGVGAVVGSFALLERADRLADDAAMTELELMQARVPSAPSARASAFTDRGSPVVLKEPTSLDAEGRLGTSEGRVLANTQMSSHVIRRGPADPRANCHGWVFTGGRFLVSGEDVERILRENDYQEVAEPQPGDVVVYRQGGAVAHTAVVRYLSEGQPVLVEGKWGSLGVFLHPVEKSVYGTEFTFHRSPRAGHLLAGLGGKPASGDARLPSAAE